MAVPSPFRASASSPHDALYVALAEALEATLTTFDERLARSAGFACEVEVAGRY